MESVRHSHDFPTVIPHSSSSLYNTLIGTLLLLRIQKGSKPKPLMVARLAGCDEAKIPVIHSEGAGFTVVNQSKVMNFHRASWIAVVSIAVLTAGCGHTGLEAPSLIASNGPDSTKTSVPSTENYSPTATPTLTPTPTSTAIPISLIDMLLHEQQTALTPQPGAPCGVVDTLDFPLDPPDGKNVAYGGQDFGVYRENYHGFHTGEDWWGPRNSTSSFGTPVHSIGHGVVTYAEPNGWGRDQGVIILRHTFPDGSKILSFYGHLHPPSVTLRIGDCVVRGEQIGTIGRPRSSPHLHFEIREHMPSSTGRGYWSSDPTKFGWKAPSLFIWTYRMKTSPGVEWFLPSDDDFVQRLGIWNGDTAVAIGETELIGIDIEDGSLLWKLQIPDQSIAALFDDRLPLVYTVNHRRDLLAFDISVVEGGDLSSDSDHPLASIWKIPLNSLKTPTLLPLPGGGVVVSVGDRLMGVSPIGEVLWRHDPVARPMDWLQVNRQLIMTTTGRNDPIWTIDENGPVAWAVQLSGHLAVNQEQVWVYADDGVYLLNTEQLSAELVHPLPKGLLYLGDMIALPDGSLFLTHTDIYDKRLILMGPDGELRWQRSFSGVFEGRPSLIELGGQLYLGIKVETISSELLIYSVDLNSGELTRVFKGGTRNPRPTVSSFLKVGENRLLINVWGASLVMLDMQMATEANTR
jgi:murein DD-endopeptidase MepM/ murein hydrolase activator NlpD